MKIVILGTGYVGLVSGVCFADQGHNVICVDVDQQKIDLLKRGISPIFEPGLPELLASVISDGNIEFTQSLPQALESAAVVFIAVGTPPSPNDGAADLSHVFRAAEEIAMNAKQGTIVVVKSTVPVGTGDRVEELFSNIRGKDDIAVVSNPEFLREGAAISDFMTPDRVVVGTENQAAKRTMLEVYRKLVDKNVPLIFTRRRTSELIKYASNAFLATKITFINEMADLCESVDADINDLSLGMGLDHRIGAQFLKVGPGYGGSCFPKDTLALIKLAAEHRTNLRLVETTVSSNLARKQSMAHRLAGLFDTDMAGKTVAVLGLSFKANTDDTRESPALALIAGLQKMETKIRAYDPVAMENASDQLEGVKLCINPYQCALGAHAIVIATEWEEFKNLDFAKLRLQATGDVILDLRNIINVKQAAQNGFRVSRLGYAVDVDLSDDENMDIEWKNDRPFETLQHIQDIRR